MSRRTEAIATRIAMALVAIVAAGAAITCVDARGTFEDFGDRVGTRDASSIDGAELSEIPDVSGEFLFSLDPKPVAEGTFIRFIATMSLDIAADRKTATADLSLQPIGVLDGEPIGDPLVHQGVPVNTAGRFEIVVDTALDAIPADANPVTGADIGLDGVLVGQLLEGDTDRFCGTVSGTVKPTGTVIDGSTFGAVRIAPGTTGNDNLPEPLGECPAPGGGEADAGVDAPAEDAGVDGG